MARPVSVEPQYFKNASFLEDDLRKILDDVELGSFVQKVYEELILEFKEAEFMTEGQRLLWLDRQATLLQGGGMESRYCIYSDLKQSLGIPHPLLIRIYFSYEGPLEIWGCPRCTLVCQHIKFGESETVYEVLEETRHICNLPLDWGQTRVLFDSQIDKFAESHPDLFFQSNPHASSPTPRFIGKKDPPRHPSFHNDSHTWFADFRADIFKQKAEIVYARLAGANIKRVVL